MNKINEEAEIRGHEQQLRNVLAAGSIQPRVAFYLGVNVAMHWDLAYDDLYALAESSPSLVACIGAVAAMRYATAEGRLAAGLTALERARR